MWGEQTKRKNNKTAQPKPKQQKKQQKKQHYFCPEKRYKRNENAEEKPNERKKLVATKSKRKTHRKQPKGHQKGKTAQRGQPCLSQARCQQGDKNSLKNFGYKK